MQSGFDILGAQTIEELIGASKQSIAKAKAAGERAVAASKKITKRAPKLAASIAKAGQKAISSGKTKGKKAKKPKKSAPPLAALHILPSMVPPAAMHYAARPSAVAMRSAMVRPSSAAMRSAMVPSAAMMRSVVTSSPASTRPVAPVAMPAATRSTSAMRGQRIALGSDASGLFPGDAGYDASTEDGDLGETEEQVNAYTTLADAATQIVGLIVQIQDLISQLPPEIPLVTSGLNAINSVSIVFGEPLEAAISGNTVKQLPGLLSVWEDIVKVQQFETPRVGIWDWIDKAKAYLAFHPPAGAAEGPAPVSDGTTPTVPGSTVAKVVVSPISISVAQGLTQPFTAQITDAAGNPTTPKTPVTWSVTPTTGASLDQTGLFSAQSGGSFTVTANADGVTSTGTAMVQSSAGGGGAPASGGGGGGGGGGDSGAPAPADSGVPADTGMPPMDQGAYADQDGGYYPEGGGYAAPSEEYYAEEEGGEYASEEDPFADEGGAYEGEGDVDDSEVGNGFELLIGKGGGKGGGGGGKGGGGGGKGGGHHHHGGRGRRGGGGWWGGGPWYVGPWYDGYEILEEELTAEELAEAVARKLKKKGVAIGRGGRGGGGHRGGGHRHHHHGGGGRRGGFGGWWDGPWGYEGFEILDTSDDDLTVDEIAEAVAKRIKERKKGAIVGAYDIQQSRRQLDTLKQLPVAVARAIVKHALQVVSETLRIAEGGTFQRALPGMTSLRNTQGHLQWHVEALSKLSDPTSIYASGEDLKKWAMQAWVDANAVEEGRARQSEIWDAMWMEIGEELSKMPAKIVKAATALPGQLVEAVTGIPMWLFWVGGALVVGLVIAGVWKLLKIATPIAAHRLMR